jgi:hypothetical protein
VTEGRPWFFEGNTTPTEMPFHLASFWVRMFNLPLACMGRATGEKLGSLMGDMEEVEMDEEGVSWGEFLRVRIKLNLFRPLLRGRMLKVRDKTYWVKFQYEKILRICFDCEAICHGASGCPKRSSRRNRLEEHKLEYGPWLRVSFSRRGWENERNHFEHNMPGSSSVRGSYSSRCSEEQPSLERENQTTEDSTSGNHENTINAIKESNKDQIIGGVREGMKRPFQMRVKISGYQLGEKSHLRNGHLWNVRRM